MAMSAPGSASGWAEPTPTPAGRTSIWLWIALLMSVLTLAGSLGLSLMMGLKACPLCFYQRTFAMSLVAVLGIGLLTRAGQSARVALMCLPLALGGMGVAAFHVSLEVRDILECPVGLFGLGTAPQQSLVMFVLTVILLLADIFTRRAVARHEWMGFGAGILLGAVLAFVSSVSNPPMPGPPTKAYEVPPDICRRPYQPG